MDFNHNGVLFRLVRDDRYTKNTGGFPELVFFLPPRDLCMNRCSLPSSALILSDGVL